MCLGAQYEFDSGLNSEEWEVNSYRHRTIACLRRYFRMSIEAGRMPSLLGREFFRAKVTSYRAHTFEDAVIFVHDMECALELLDRDSKEMVARIIFMEYTQEEAALQLDYSRRTVMRQFPEMLDNVTKLLLERGLLETKTPRRKSRQLVVRK